MKNKYYIRVVLILISCLILISSCMQTPAEAEPIGFSNTFVIVESTNDWCVVYCNKTKVMYTVSKGSYNRGNFTLLVNPDGTPMIWEG